MLKFKQSGDFSKTKKCLEKLSKAPNDSLLDKYGQKGVDALSAATPVDTGKTASGWSYSIEKNEKGITIFWKNSNRNKGVPIALVLQYGHGNGHGGYIAGIDYINPAMRPIFEQLSAELGKELHDA